MIVPFTVSRSLSARLSPPQDAQHHGCSGEARDSLLPDSYSQLHCRASRSKSGRSRACARADRELVLDRRRDQTRSERLDPALRLAELAR
eukprot:11055516-Heterocapsa_arctica.AAC.1